MKAARIATVPKTNAEKTHLMIREIQQMKGVVSKAAADMKRALETVVNKSISPSLPTS